MEPKDLLFFDKMLTSQIILVVYWLLLLSAGLGGLALIIGGSFVGGIASAVGGAVAARITCELLIVVFKMNEALQAIRNR